MRLVLCSTLALVCLLGMSCAQCRTDTPNGSMSLDIIGTQGGLLIPFALASDPEKELTIYASSLQGVIIDSVSVDDKPLEGGNAGYVELGFETLEVRGDYVYHVFTHGPLSNRDNPCWDLITRISVTDYKEHDLRCFRIPKEARKIVIFYRIELPGGTIGESRKVTLGRWPKKDSKPFNL